ncbi:TlyA family RNA methyltransferase [Flavobacteriales bacterium]|nr:TlyA family RNA methyltransferase [Flavobacteriales bacterium]
MEPLRLDRLLVERGLAASRPRAEWLIAEHGVKVNGTIVHKPGKKVPADAVLEPLGEELPWVSRGAPNLIAALDQFDLDPSGRNILDLGASTGGFTEVCLHRNAAHVHAVDVGSGQLSINLKSDPRVKNLEQLNLKDLRREHLDPTPNTVVIDLSFISLSHVWPRLTQWVSPQGWGVALVKPQFEVGQKHLGRNGIVRDDKIRNKALLRCIAEAEAEGFTCTAPIDSPIEGASGNREFLLHFSWGQAG